MKPRNFPGRVALRRKGIRRKNWPPHIKDIRVRMGRAKRAAMTRMLYKWEKEMPTPPVRPIAELRHLGERIWRENTGRRDRCPRIVAGRGMEQAGRLLSYCEGRNLIVLARQQRERMTLIHEMVHALGPETHGLRFQTKYADLLGRYL